MIGGIIMILTVIWVYQAVIEAKKPKGFYWVVGCAVAFLAVQYLAVQLNILIIDTFQGEDIITGYEGETERSIDERMQINQAGQPDNSFLNVFYEILPPFSGFFVVAFIRTYFIKAEALTIGNLFSGITSMFSSIKNSFVNVK